MSDQVTTMITSAIQAVLASAKLGYVGYACLALCVIGLLFLKGWLTKQEIAAAKKKSDQQAQKDQAGNASDNQNISDSLNNAHDNIDEIRKENPDTEKKKRDNGTS